jgi:hypothetical protein
MRGTIPATPWETVRPERNVTVGRDSSRERAETVPLIPLIPRVRDTTRWSVAVCGEGGRKSLRSSPQTAQSSNLCACKIGTSEVTHGQAQATG